MKVAIWLRSAKSASCAMALMNSLPSFDPIDSLFENVAQLMEQLPNLQHRQLIQQTLATVVRLANSEIDRLDWKILSASLADMERGLELFHTYRHVRKVTIFGSARTPIEAPEYQMAAAFGCEFTKFVQNNQIENII